MTELAYFYISSGNTQSSTKNAFLNTWDDLTGLNATVNVGAKPIKIELYVPSGYCNATSNSGVSLRVQENGTAIGTAVTFFGTQPNHTPVLLALRRNPTAGTVTYNAQFASTFGGTATVEAQSPIYLRVTED